MEGSVAEKEFPADFDGGPVDWAHRRRASQCREARTRVLLSETTRSLFDVGLGLQTLAQETPDSTARRRLDAAVNLVEHLIRELQAEVFAP